MNFVAKNYYSVKKKYPNKQAFKFEYFPLSSYRAQRSPSQGDQNSLQMPTTIEPS